MKGYATVILRGYTYEQVRSVCEVLKNGKKVKNVEITLNTPNALETIEKIIADFKDDLCIGAGTVITFDDLKKVIALGASFVLSPIGYTEEMIQYIHKHGATAIPAAFTPSEIYEQIQRGADIVKVFPANELSSHYAKKVCEPLGNLPLMAVGGVNKDNVADILTDGGFQYVGSAGGIFAKNDIKEQNKENLARWLSAFEEQLPD